MASVDGGGGRYPTGAIRDILPARPQPVDSEHPRIFLGTPMKSFSPSRPRASRPLGMVALLLFAGVASADAADPAVKVVEEGGLVRVTWPVSDVEDGSAVFSMDKARPLIESLGVAARGEAGGAIATGLN